MPPVGFEPTISAGERPKTYALDRAATGIGRIKNLNLRKEICTVLGFYTAYYRSTYRCCGTSYLFHIQGTAIEDGTDRLSRNVGKKLIFFVAQNP